MVLEGPCASCAHKDGEEAGIGGIHEVGEEAGVGGRGQQICVAKVTCVGPAQQRLFRRKVF